MVDQNGLHAAAADGIEGVELQGGGCADNLAVAQKSCQVHYACIVVASDNKVYVMVA